jgi:hypothetical protein
MRHCLGVWVGNIRQQHRMYEESGAVVSNEPGNPTIQDEYASRLADDLASNARKRAELQAQLAQLEQEHAWLIKLQNAIADEPSALQQQAAAEEAPTSPDDTDQVVADAAAARAIPRPRDAGEPSGRRARTKAAAPKGSKSRRPRRAVRARNRRCGPSSWVSSPQLMSRARSARSSKR